MISSSRPSLRPIAPATAHPGERVRVARIDAERHAPGTDPRALFDEITTLAFLAAGISILAMLAPAAWNLSWTFFLGMGIAVAAAHAVHDARCRAHPPRVRSLAGLLWAPAGRIRRIPAGSPLLAAKSWYFDHSTAPAPMLVWAGWWNCDSFPGDPAEEEHVFRGRGPVRFAIPARDLVPVPTPDS